MDMMRDRGRGLIQAKADQQTIYIQNHREIHHNMSRNQGGCAIEERRKRLY